MAEKVVVRQNSQFETEFEAPPPHEPDSGHLHSVTHIHDLTPYGMLLASLGSCTAIILNTYAHNHGVSLEEVEIVLSYEREFLKDCEHCEEISRYTERIEQEILLSGDLTARERSKLFAISQQCPIDKMLMHGIQVTSQLTEEADQGEA
jgi:uncharacterized OsmC-like protein